MKSQSKNDMICFDSRCIAANKQLFSSSEKESQFHYEENHPLECLTHGSPFFRSLNTQTIDLPLSRNQIQESITKVYSNFLHTIQNLIVRAHEKQAANIDSLYVLAEKGLNFNNLMSHLSTQTSTTEFCLEILNFKFNNRPINIKQYLINLPKTLLSKINRKNKRISKKMLSLIFDDQSSIDIDGETDTTYDLKQILSQLPEIDHKRYSQALEKIQQKPIFELKRLPIMQTKLPIKPRQEQSKQKYTIQFEDKNKRFQRNPALKWEIYQHITRQFLKSQMGYRYFPPKLREIIGLEQYRYFQSEVVLKIYKGIKGYISIHFHERDRRYSYVNSQFKKYKRWMTDSQISTFKSCILKFSGVNPDEHLIPADVYHVYIIIMVQMAKISKKPLSYVHPQEHLHLLNIKILYLYFTLESLEKVYQLLSCAYPKDPEVSVINVMRRFKQVLLETLNKIRQINDNHIYTVLKELLEKEKDIGSLQWKQVVIDLTEYALTEDKDNIGKLNKRVIHLIQQKLGTNFDLADNSHIFLETQKPYSQIYEEQSQALQLQQRSKRRQRVCDKIKIQALDVINDNSMHEEEDFHELDDSQKNND